MTTFFPDTTFGLWYLALLLTLLLAAAVCDVRSLAIPKKLALAILAAGVFGNVVRGFMIGRDASVVWILPAGPVLGALDGVLFSLGGIVIGFLLTLPLFAVGIAGGGDGKLFAATAAWTGPVVAIWILAISGLVMTALLLVRMIALVAFAGRGLLSESRNSNGPAEAPLKRFMAYSPALLVAVAFYLPWIHRSELFASPSQPSAATGEASNARRP